MFLNKYVSMQIHKDLVIINLPFIISLTNFKPNEYAITIIP